MIRSGTLRRLSGTAAALAILGSLTACGGGGSGDNDGRGLSCSDFAFQEDAQAAFAAGATQLDADNDGIACETLPNRPSTPPPTSTIVEGFYTGTIAGNSTSTAFQMLSLENGDVWALYGNPSGSSFLVRGFLQGSTTRNGSSVTSSNVKDFGVVPAAAATVTGTLTSSSVSGTITSNGAAVSFTGTPPASSGYVYNTAANPAQITGNWTLGSLDGTTTTVTITSAGNFTGNNAGCALTGTIRPRASGKNVFDVTVTGTGSSCGDRGGASTGIAVTYLLPGTSTRELVVAGTNAGRTAGNVYFGLR